MVIRHHYLTSLGLLALPVVTIFALTTFGIKDGKAEKEQKIETDSGIESVCQHKQMAIESEPDFTSHSQ
jgi:hypothetical protein